jgi:hypothetical protein
MEPNDAEETLSQALEYRNSLRRKLNFDWSQEDEEEAVGGGALGRDAQEQGRGSGGGALGRDAQG